MCGINGVLVLEGDHRVSPEAIEKARDTMIHRGPDGAGCWIADDGRIGFGFRRLAIIDLSPQAMQPMTNEDGSLRLVFNGEIYNHAEIRKELEAIGGHRWATDHSDSEVILHAFEEWGIDCLDRFRGMFAFALWDGRNRTLWLVRDRIGIKPLYYSVHHGRLTFASEIKALLADPEQPRAVDEEALFHYLSFLTTPAPQTLFAGVRKLPAGSLLRVSADGTMSERRWWDVWDHVTPLTGVSEAEIAERVLAELKTAVSLRKVSDVPVGVFLSGGIDSSTNAALFSQGETRPVKTFSIGYEGEYQSYKNELHWARRMADEVGAEHHELLLTQDDLLEFLPRMVQLQDEPIADPVCVPVYYVSKLARDNGVDRCAGRRGRGRAVHRLPVLAACAAAAGLGRSACALAGQAAGPGRPPDDGTRRRTAVRMAPTRGGRAAGLLGWRRGLHAATEGASGRPAAARRRMPGRTSWDALAPIRRRFEDDSVGQVCGQLDDLPRPEPAASRAPAHACRQDEHGRQPGRAGPLSRPQAR